MSDQVSKVGLGIDAILLAQFGNRERHIQLLLGRQWLHADQHWQLPRLKQGCRNILPLIGQLISRNRQLAYTYLPQSVAEFPQGEVLAGMMEECGLSQVRWTPMTFGIATLYIGHKPVQTPAGPAT